MSRNGAGVYSLPAGYAATTGQIATAAQHNDPLEDLAADNNAARPIVAGGTGSTTVAGARTNLGLVIGTDVQAYNATLTSIAALGSASDKALYTTGANSWAEMTITAAGRALLDDADAAAQRTTLGLGTFATQNTADFIKDQTAWDAGTSTDESTITPAKLKAVIDDRVGGWDYTSAATTLTASTGGQTFTHGLGARPTRIELEFVCTSAESGFSVGDRIVSLSSSFTAASNRGLSVYIPSGNTTQIHINTLSSLRTVSPSGTEVSITFPNWDVVVKASL